MNKVGTRSWPVELWTSVSVKKKKKKKSWALLLWLRKTNKNKYKLNLQNNLVFNVWNSTERKSQTAVMTTPVDISIRHTCHHHCPKNLRQSQSDRKCKH